MFKCCKHHLANGSGQSFKGTNLLLPRHFNFGEDLFYHVYSSEVLIDKEKALDFLISVILCEPSKGEEM